MRALQASLQYVHLDFDNHAFSVAIVADEFYLGPTL